LSYRDKVHSIYIIKETIA